MDQPLHRYACQIVFADTDASGWMHFSNIFRYVEAAEHDYLDACGVLVFDHGQGGWPRVKVSCEYKKPLVAGDKIEVQLAISEIGDSSMSWQFEVMDVRGELVAFGGMTTVRVDQTGKPQTITSEERKALSAN